MELLGDLVGPERRSDALAFDLGGERSRSYSYDALCTNAWKAGNLMRHYGVREGVTVGIVDGPKDLEDPGPTPVPETVLGLLGAAMLGSPARFNPPSSPEVRVLVGPVDWHDRYDLPPGSKYLAYGGDPADPTVVNFERELWSENPIPMPSEFGPETPALATPERTYDHTALLDAGREVVSEHGIDSDDRIALSAPLSDPGTIVAGVIAPLLAGATITVGGEATLRVADRTGENVIRPESARP